MNNISIDEIEQKINLGEEIIDEYFDPASTRVGVIHQITSYGSENIVKTNLDLPFSMFNELEFMANELNISLESVMKMMLRRSLDEHYLAKGKF